MTELAYVFIYLPGDVSPIVAGCFELDGGAATAVGRFVYGESYLHNPSALPLILLRFRCVSNYLRQRSASGARCVGKALQRFDREIDLQLPPQAQGDTFGSVLARELLR